MGEGTDGRGAESRMAAPGRAGGGGGDFVVSAPGRSPVLDAAELEVLRGYGTERDVAAGEVLFADGDETYDLIVMLDGTAEIIQGYGQPGATFIAGYGRSQFLGEIGMLTGQRAYLTAVATSAGRVLAVPVARLRAVMASEPGLSDLILRTFLLRHSILMRRGAGLTLIGSRFDPDTRRLLEILARNRLVSTWLDYESHAAALDRNELGALLVAAGLGSPAEHALISLLALNGLRVSEATGADIEHLGLERGHRTLTITRKGGKVVTVPLAPRTARAIDLAIGERTGGPVFLAADGRRLDRHGAGRIVRKTARRARIGKSVTPHTLRHAFITAALDAGVPLRDVQEAASHADPRTTRVSEAVHDGLHETAHAGRRDRRGRRGGSWRVLIGAGGEPSACCQRRACRLTGRSPGCWPPRRGGNPGTSPGRRPPRLRPRRGCASGRCSNTTPAATISARPARWPARDGTC